MNSSDRKTILYVGDHADTRAAVEPLLREAGYVILSCASAEQAANISTAVRFDLLIVDFGLPNGPEAALLSQLGARQPIKGLALIEPGTQSDAAGSIEAGFDQHLAKPLRPAELLNAVQHIFGVPSDLRRPGETEFKA